MLFPPLRFLAWLVLALLPATAGRAAEFEGSYPSTDAYINARESERTKYYNDASYEQAIAASLRGYARAVELGSIEHRMLFLRHLTFDNWLLGNTENALEHGLQLLRLAESAGAVANRSRAHRYLSQIFQTLKDYRRAERHARDALAAAEEANHPALRAFARECLGLCAMASGDFDVARRELAAALAYWKSQGATVTGFVVRREQGDLALAQGDLEGALAIYEEVVTLSAPGRNPLSNARALRRMATVLRRLGRPAEAMARLEQARPLVARVGGHLLRLEYFSELALVHEALGEFAPALAAERTALEARDAMAGAQARVQAAEAESRVDLEQKQQAIDRLAREAATRAADLRARDAELARTRTIRTAVIFAAATAVTALAVVLLAQRARLHARRLALEETRRAQVLAEDAGVLKSRLLAVASHDLKGPLRAVLRSVDALDRSAADPAAVAATAHVLRGQTQGMADLVRDLLDLGAIESGAVAIRKTDFDLVPLVASVVARHAPRAAEKRQVLQFAPPVGTGLAFRGDSARLAQAIDNLVDNAVKYTPVGGVVRVAVERRDAHFGVTVSDSGPGLGPDDLARMFQPFQRLSAEPTAGESSTGLGLHITRDFVGRHDGTVEVDTAPGRGTTFTVLLPAPPAAPVALAAAGTAT